MRAFFQDRVSTNLRRSNCETVPLAKIGPRMGDDPIEPDTTLRDCLRAAGCAHLGAQSAAALVRSVSDLLVVVALLNAFQGFVSDPFFALAGIAWLLVHSFVLAGYISRSRREGARLQELYDTRKLGVAWNIELCGHPPTPERIAELARRRYAHRILKQEESTWYPVSSINQGAAAALISQRAAAAWTCRDTQRYGRLQIAIATCLVAMLTLAAIAANLTVSQFIMLLLAPALPAVVARIESANAMRAAHRTRKRILELATDALDSLADRTPQRKRRLQDLTYLARSQYPRVPLFVYKIFRASNEDAQKYAAKVLAP